MGAMRGVSSHHKRDDLTPLQKGRKLQNDFGEYLKNEMDCKIKGYEVPVFGRISNNKHDCDIHATIESNAFHEYKKKGVVSCISGLLIILGTEIPELQNFLYGPTFIDGMPTFTLLFMIAIGFAAFYYFKMNESKEARKHIWVECKELSENVKRRHMGKFVQQVEDVRSNEHAKWHPDVLMFASKTGYDIDAENYAREYNVELYVRDGGTFRRTL